VKRLAIEASTSLEEIEETATGPGPFELDLREAPEGIPRLELLRLLMRARSPFVVTFRRTLVTPLVEIAGLASGGEWFGDVRLDLRGALLMPFLWSNGYREVKRALLEHGALVPPGRFIRPHGGNRHSPRALGLLLELLDSGKESSERLALARELAAFRFVMTLPDREEGVKAFLEKRQPSFDW
jgi:enoyl-CoA hydratase/carnithine racemase